MKGPDAPLLRGSHWRNFFVKYPESNRMHKKMMSLSALSRFRGDPPAARRAIGRAQCNDAYWHGVFGGLYLKHLRDAVWANLAEAEAILREGEPLRARWEDTDGDGHLEILITSPNFSAVVSPHRGGALEEYILFRTGRNEASVLTRRLEAYHLPPLESGDDTWICPPPWPRVRSVGTRPPLPPARPRNHHEGGMPSSTTSERGISWGTPPHGRRTTGRSSGPGLPGTLTLRATARASTNPPLLARTPCRPPSPPRGGRWKIT